MDETVSKNQLRGLTPWQKGVSGNPNGRPKGKVSITRHLERYLAENDGEKAKELADALIAQAIAGNAAAIKTVVDRIDGPIVQKVEVKEVTDLTEEEILEQLEQHGYTVLPSGIDGGTPSAEEDE